jgi:hypothetical protein
VLTLMLLYALAPKTLSGSWLFAMRFPALAGLVALALVDLTRLPRVLRVGAFAASGLALLQVLAFHVRFAEAVAGLEQVSAVQPPLRHGYLSLQGTSILGSRNIYAEHLGQWWTARGGGLGHNFFAASSRYPVQFREGAWIPESVDGQLERFDALLVFGAGPLPPSLAVWQVEAQSGAWRRIAPKR